MKWLFNISIFVIVFSCNADKPEKPFNVPKNAVWKGGVDGGCWVLFDKVSENIVEATIFYENGKIWQKGVFKKSGNCQISKEILIDKIKGFDGESLLTNESCLFKKKETI